MKSTNKKFDPDLFDNISFHATRDCCAVVFWHDFFSELNVGYEKIG